MEEPPPPWIALPGLSPADPATQGAADAYITLDWLPFWRGRAAAEKASYLDRWEASADWRAAIAERYDPPDFDLDDDLRDSERWREASASTARPWWRRWSGR